MSSEVETSRNSSEFERSQRFLDLARNDRHGDTTLCLFSSLRVYHDTPHSAAMNMAIDEVLVEHATVPSIRFYQWHSPALSFGYFGRFADVASYAGERHLVRRWTGGGIVLHGDDLTYSIAIPASDAAFSESSISIYEKIHHALSHAFIANGARAELVSVAALCERRKARKGDLQIAPAVGNRRSLSSAVADRPYSNTAITDRGCNCFANPVRADVIIDGRKVAGAAQRWTRSGLLQQGSIQGVDLGNGLAQRFTKALSANCSERKINKEILNRARELAQRKYGADSWLRKR